MEKFFEEKMRNTPRPRENNYNSQRNGGYHRSNQPQLPQGRKPMLCFNCSEPGHFARDCDKKPQRQHRDQNGNGQNPDSNRPTSTPQKMEMLQPQHQLQY